ncbi:hypothetical protein KPP03845_104232 [Streptomyces xanthophaeus]|uniref:hypothetical protein n=1 Tax=Streptomyces xanthophaeus TaxID=67385 RepID=UPI00233EE8CF|nr:hypothetical protein [Streptomyces xanthophaeus]WCD87831.1 hypothetical protein KPP03845_104232 [Streptomyces xanthophaeus]
MALFSRRKSTGPDWITDLPGRRRTTRRFYQALVRRHLDVLRTTQIAPAATWEQVAYVAIVHNNSVPIAGRNAGGVDLLDAEIQEAIRTALDQFAAQHGVRGSLVRAWGTAKLLNERIASGWERSSTVIGWWQERPIAFACILHPIKEGEPLIDGLLIFDHAVYEFTPDSERLPQVHWSRMQVREAEEPVRGATTLHLDAATGYARADIASDAVIILQTMQGPLFTDPDMPVPKVKKRRNWGSAG